MSTLNPTGLPLPDKTRGGADLLVNTDRIDAVDVAITKTEEFSRTKQMKAVTNVKFRTYHRFEQLTGFNIVPWIMSVFGEHGDEAVQAAKYWSRVSSSSTTFPDLMTFTQMELIRGLMQGIVILHARVHRFNLDVGNEQNGQNGPNEQNGQNEEIPRAGQNIGKNGQNNQ